MSFHIPLIGGDQSVLINPYSRQWAHRLSKIRESRDRLQFEKEKDLVKSRGETGTNLLTAPLNNNDLHPAARTFGIPAPLKVIRPHYSSLSSSSLVLNNSIEGNRTRARSASADVTMRSRSNSLSFSINSNPSTLRNQEAAAKLELEYLNLKKEARNKRVRSASAPRVRVWVPGSKGVQLNENIEQLETLKQTKAKAIALFFIIVIFFSFK